MKPKSDDITAPLACPADSILDSSTTCLFLPTFSPQGPSQGCDMTDLVAAREMKMMEAR